MNNWLNGMPNGGLSELQRQQLAQAQAQNNAGLGIGGIPNFNPAMMGGVNMNNLTPAQKQQIALQQHAARMNAGLGNMGHMNQQGFTGQQAHSGIEGRMQMLEQENAMLLKAVKDIAAGKTDVKLSPTMSNDHSSGDRFTMSSAGVKQGSASLYEDFTKPHKKNEVEIEEDYSQGSRFIENGFGSFKHKLETKEPETPKQSQGDKIMPSNVKIDSDLTIGAIHRIEDTYITTNTLTQMHEIHKGLADPYLGGFISAVVETCDVSTVPLSFVNSGLWTNNPERFSVVLKGFLEKAGNTEDRLYFQIVDDIITDRVNDYLDTTYGGRIDSYAHDMKEATHAICGAFNIVQSTFEKEIGDIVSDVIGTAYTNAINDLTTEAVESGETKETIPVDIQSSGLLVYINFSSRDIGLDDVETSVLREIDPNSTSQAIQKAYEAVVKYTGEVLNKPGYVTTYLATRDRKTYKFVRNKSGNVYIARHFTR